MSRFVVTFEGTGYDLYLADNQKIGGFFVSVRVESESVEEAVQLAYEKLVASRDYQGVASGERPDSALAVSECIESSEPDPSIQGISGFVFYLETKPD
jgi:hypothetical protein